MEDDGVNGDTSLTGTRIEKELSGTDKMWNTFSALGDIAFAYAFSTVLIEIQAMHISLNNHQLRPVF